MTPQRDVRDLFEENSTIQQLARIIGEDAAVALSIRYGGRRLYVPKLAIRAPELAQLIGTKALELLVRRFGGTSIEMPLERGKRERIIALSDRGKPVREIAEIIGCTERHVKYVRAEYRKYGGVIHDVEQTLNTSQTDMFANLPPTPDTE